MRKEFARLQRAFANAWAGVRFLFENEPNARIHLILAGAASLLAWGLGFSTTEWALLALTIGMVLVAEAMNTAMEALTDLVHPQRHPLAKAAKDVAAGGVLMAAFMAVIVALFLFLPKLMAVFQEYV